MFTFQSYTRTRTHTYTYIFTDQFLKTTSGDYFRGIQGTSKDTNQVKTQHRKFSPKTILPLPYGSTVMEVIEFS